MPSHESRDVFFERQVEVESVDQVLSVDQKLECEVGSVVWDSALLLAKYLDFNSDRLGLRSAHVIELGAGTGFCALMAATLGAHVVATDLSFTLDVMRRNVRKNELLVKDRITVEEFDWSLTDPQKQDFFGLKLDEIDFIIVSDCVYYEESVEHLFQTILWLSSKGATVLLSYEERDDKKSLVNRFFNLLEKKFMISEIASEELHPEYRSQDLHLLRIKQIL